MISFEMNGGFDRTLKYLQKLATGEIHRSLSKWGAKGVQALSSATPVDTGKTASSWTYEVEAGMNQAAIHWENTNINNGVNIAVILQLGHGTGTGGYVQGRDYINPAIQPIFDQIADDLWKEVTNG